jgi:diguanylate cyclase (GGDEF)-like protein
MKALIAEDEPIQRLLLQRCLAEWGYGVLTASDGHAALDVLTGPDAPTLAVLDWDMPGLDGTEVCRHVRARASSRYTYILLLTGRDARQDMLHGLDAGADDYLLKPFDPSELRARLNTGRRILHLQGELISAREALREQATRDGLTGVLNHAAALDLLARELERCRQEGRPAGVVLADIDHFKRVNDTHGHQAGDAVLRGFASRISATVRPGDLVGRYGGEEFLIALPGCDPAATVAICERIRLRTSEKPFRHDAGAIPVTVSLGAAMFTGQGDAVTLVRDADAALYRAKAGGRGRTELFRPRIRREAPACPSPRHRCRGARGSSPPPALPRDHHRCSPPSSRRASTSSASTSRTAPMRNIGRHSIASAPPPPAGTSPSSPTCAARRSASASWPTAR